MKTSADGEKHRTPMEALEEIRDRIQWFCGQVPGKWNPPWAQEIYEIACLALVDEWVKKANETNT